MALVFDVVTPAGSRLHEEAVDCVVVRRLEAAHDLGSEVAIYPRHGPLLMRTQAGTARFKRGAVTRELSVGYGVLEVYRDHVTLVER
jgi:F0F1-type ATP synthase epsilon subunit